jgi:methyl-accepting chemotaxis protein
MDIKQQTGMLNDMVARALGGDYSPPAQADGLDEDLKPLYEGIRRIIETQRKYGFEMQSSASQVLSVTEDLGITLDENAAFTAELLEQAGRIRSLNARSREDTAEALQEMRDFITHIDRIRDASGRAKSLGEETQGAISGGLKLVDSMMGEIREIEAATNETVAYVRSFIASTGKITDILHTVEDISRQMELISFNALVESRRAGLEGRSFGVIASAFRDLTDRSKREVSDIYDVIGAIHTESGKLTEMISQNAAGVQHCAAHSDSIADGLSSIRTNFDAVTDALIEVYRHAEDQGLIAQNVSQSVLDIENNSEQVNAGFDGIYAAVRKQKSEMDELTGLGAHLQKASQSLSQFVQGTENRREGADDERIAEAARQVFALMDNSVLREQAFYTMDAQAHKRLLDRLLERGEIESVWSNYLSGKFVYSNPPAGISNARIRPWFKKSAAGSKYVSDVYISAITRQPCVTVSVPIMSGGACIGVLGADLKLG